MTLTRPRLPGILGLVASALGLFFAAFSTHDYAAHLDRQLHANHCSFLPGLVGAESGANACTTAMYSPYSAILRDKYWGGVPISLFALGAYAFFVAFAVFLLTAGNAASKRSWQAFGVATFGPAVASAIMFTISATKLGAFCKLCVGLYVSSLILVSAGILALKWAGGKASLLADQTIPDPHPPFATPAHGAYAVPSLAPPLSIPTGGPLAFAIAFDLLGLFAVAPAFAYVSALPDYHQYMTSCGKLTEATEKHGALLHIPTTTPRKPALVFEDPLCPQCKAFHDRLVTEGVYDKLDITVAPFPLDSECNWMLDRDLHPGACVLAKAVLCGEKSNESRAILEWSYANQETLRDAGKAGKDALRAKVKEKFPDVDACLDAKETKQRMDRIFHFAVANKIPLSTPQFFLDGTRICDEDTDLGLTYTIGQLAPELLAP